MSMDNQAANNNNNNNNNKNQPEQEDEDLSSCLHLDNACIPPAKSWLRSMYARWSISSLDATKRIILGTFQTAHGRCPRSATLVRWNFNDDDGCPPDTNDTDSICRGNVSWHLNRQSLFGQQQWHQTVEAKTARTLVAATSDDEDMEDTCLEINNIDRMASATKQQQQQWNTHMMTSPTASSRTVILATFRDPITRIVSGIHQACNKNFHWRGNATQSAATMTRDEIFWNQIIERRVREDEQLQQVAFSSIGIFRDEQ